MYDYIAAGSAHKKTMFASIARSECMRMILTNSHRKQFLKNMRFFANKARNRGHCVRQIIQKTKHIDHANRFNMLQRWRQKRAQKNLYEIGKCKLGVTVSYFRGPESLNWHKLRDANLLANNISHVEEQNRALIVRCKLGPNIFRQLYRQMWLGG